MKNTFLITLALLVSLLFASCREREKEPEPVPEAVNGQLAITLKTLWHIVKLENEDIYNDIYGNRLRIDNFKSYICHLELVRTDGSAILLKDYYLADLGQDHSFNFTVPKGEYSGVRFYLGVPPEVNKDQDPAQYPNSHPLSVAGSQGMFWTWNTGYVFTKLEGKADPTGNDNEPLLHSFAYHTGDDVSGRMVELLNDHFVVSSGQTTNIKITLHTEKIFSPDTGDGINPVEESTTHSPGPLSEKFVNNFAKAFSIE